MSNSGRSMADMMMMMLMILLKKSNITLQIYTLKFILTLVFCPKKGLSLLPKIRDA